MSSQGFTGLPLAVASFRHVTVAHAGYRYRLQSGAVASFIDRSAPPFTPSHNATRVTTFVVCFGSAARDDPQTLCRGWSLPVRLRCTRNTRRAQQRNTNAATGSSGFRPRIHPGPNRRSAFSQRLSQVSVKAYRIGVSRRLVAGYLIQVNRRPLLAELSLSTDGFRLTFAVTRECGLPSRHAGRGDSRFRNDATDSPLHRLALHRYFSHEAVGVAIDRGDRKYAAVPLVSHHTVAACDLTVDH